MKKYIFPIIFVIAVTTWAYIAYCHDYGNPFRKREYKEVEVIKILKVKYAEVNTQDYLGNVVTKRYFLYDDGYLQVVNLKNYISFNEGDTITWTETIEIN